MIYLEIINKESGHCVGRKDITGKKESGVRLIKTFWQGQFTDNFLMQHSFEPRESTKEFKLFEPKI